MKITTKIFIALLGFTVLTSAGSAFAQEEKKMSQLDRGELKQIRASGDRASFKALLRELNIKQPSRPRLTDEQKKIVKELKQAKDKDAIRDQLDRWGIEKYTQRDKSMGLKTVEELQKLTKEQKEIIKELHESGDDKQLVRIRLLELGVELPERPKGPEITNEQKEKISELKEAGDRDAVKSYLEEIGLRKSRKFMSKRTEFTDSLSKDEKEVIQEARDIARAGDKETARELLKEVFEPNENFQEQSPRRIFGFFNKIFR
jgi:hypothetical protein